MMNTKSAVRPSRVQRTILNVELPAAGAAKVEDAMIRISDRSPSCESDGEAGAGGRSSGWNDWAASSL